MLRKCIFRVLVTLVLLLPAVDLFMLRTTAWVLLLRVRTTSRLALHAAAISGPWASLAMNRTLSVVVTLTIVAPLLLFAPLRTLHLVAALNRNGPSIPVSCTRFRAVLIKE